MTYHVSTIPVQPQSLRGSDSGAKLVPRFSHSAVENEEPSALGSTW